jgi:uncharacterized protein (DUF2236 family)
MAAWVHNVLTDSFLTAYREYGPQPLSTDDADRFVLEQTRIGALLGADPMPETAAELASWVADHPELQRTESLGRSIDFLRDPPLSIPVKVGYKVLLGAAVATLPPRIAELTGLTPTDRGRRTGEFGVKSLRWALGSSPSWHVSLVRCGAPVPDGLFRQPLRVD